MLTLQNSLTHPNRLKNHISTSRFGNHQRNALWPPFHRRLNFWLLCFPFEAYQFVTNLLFDEPLKLAVNLTSVGKNRRDISKVILLRYATIFWSYRTCMGRSEASSLVINCPSISITATSKIICLPKPLRFLRNIFGRWLILSSATSAYRRIGSTIASTRNYLKSFATNATTSSVINS